MPDILRVIAPGSTAPFEEMLQRWRAVGNTGFDLTARGLNLKHPTPETKALPLEKLAGRSGLVMVITFYSPSCLDQETATRPLGL